MVDQPTSDTHALLDNRNVSKSDLNELLEVDAELDSWNFHDVSIDSGAFGELVDAGVITEGESGYSIARKDDLQAAVGKQQSTIKMSMSESVLNRSLRGLQDFLSTSASLYTLAILVLVFVGGYLRFRNLGTDPFWLDEAWHVWAADSFASGGGFVLPGGDTYKRSWLTVSLPISVLFGIAQPTEAVARLPTVVAATAMIIVSYYFGRVFLNKPAGLLLSGTVAFDVWMLTWSQQARMYSHLQLLFVTTLLLFYIWWSREELRFRSPYLYALAVVGFFGYQTHISYLGVGGIIFVFVAITHLYEIYLVRWTPVEVNYIRHERQLVIIPLFCIAGLVVVAFKGVPDLLLGHTPAWYQSSRDASFYWQFLQERSFALYIFQFWIGTLYLIYRGAAGRLLVLAFYLPFMVYGYLAEFIIPRYIFHVYPVYLLISLSTIAVVIEHVSLDDIASGLDLAVEVPDTLVRSVSADTAARVVVCLILVFSIASPMAALHTIDNERHGLLDNRPDHEGASQYLAGNVSEDDLVFSSTPSLTRWYYGDVDYALKYTGADPENRAGAVLLEDPDELESVLTNNSGWIVLDHRYHWYAPDEIKAVVENNSAQVTEGWNGVSIRYFGDVATPQNWDEHVAYTSGNVKTAGDNIALGRTKDGGVQETGEIDFEVDNPQHLRLRSFGQDERFVNVYGSETGDEWELILAHNAGGWKTQFVDLPEEYSYIRVRGGSPGKARLGGLVKYVVIR
jgi:hypothetical protein